MLIANILVLLRLPKNPQYTGTDERQTVPVTHALETIRIELTRPTLRSFILYIALLFAVIAAVTLFIQPISNDLGIRVGQLGFLYAGFRLLSAAGAYYSETIRNVMGIYGWLYTISFVLGGLYVGALVLPIAILLAFLLMDMTLRVTRSFAAQYINDNISSLNRATLLSAASMIYTAVRIPFIVAAGLFADTNSQFGAVSLVGIILIGGAAILSVIEPPVTIEKQK